MIIIAATEYSIIRILNNYSNTVSAIWMFGERLYNGSPYAIGPLSCHVCPICLSLSWCIVAKRLDGSRCHLVRR